MVGTFSLSEPTIDPPWVQSVQAAELWAAVGVVRIAVYSAARRLALGTDSKGSHHVLLGGSYLSSCRAQQRLPNTCLWCWA